MIAQFYVMKAIFGSVEMRFEFKENVSDNSETAIVSFVGPCVILMAALFAFRFIGASSIG